MGKILRLNYPAALVGQPVVSHLIGQFKLEVNILRAQVGRDDGWLIVEIEGTPKRIQNAEAWLREQGLEVVENPALEPE